MHAVTIMSLKNIGLIICRHCVDQQTDSSVSLNFSRTSGSEAIEKWKGKDLFSPLASISGGAFALPDLQLVPPLNLETHFTFLFP